MGSFAEYTQYHVCMESARPSENHSVLIDDLSRSHPVAARVLRRWRELSGGLTVRDQDRRTLIAVSGGADSVALAAIIALVEPKPIIAHILHDLRSEAQVHRDRDAAAEVASKLGCEFVEHSVKINAQQGNTEHNARNARYHSLGEIAEGMGLKYIATGHHADDQLETMIMNISRGAGARGVAGIQDSREMDGLSVIRPMLAVSRMELEALCELADLKWVHDSTNDDESLTRNRIRHQLLPVLNNFDASFSSRASSSADSVRSTVQALDQVVKDHIWPLGIVELDSVQWPKERLCSQHEGALHVLLRLAVEHLNNGQGFDSMNKAAIQSAITAITDDSTQPRECRVGPIVVSVRSSTVTISRVDS